MKRRFSKIMILLCLLCLVCGLFYNQLVFAEQQCGGVSTSILSCDDDKGVSHILRLVIDILSIGVGIVGVIGISWVGIEYLNSRGDATLAAKARKRFFELLIGIVCYALLYGVVAWLLPGGISEIVIPKTETTTENNGTSGSSSSSGGGGGGGGGQSSGSSSSGSSDKNSTNRKKATVSEKNRENMIEMKGNGKNVTIVGDSITWRTLKAGGFAEKFSKAVIRCERGKRTFNDDAEHGGTAGNGGASGKTIINELIASGKLRDIVVTALGSNDGGQAALTAEALQGLVDTINRDGRHSIFFLTNYNYHKAGNTGTFRKVSYAKNNKAFKTLQANNDNVMVIDWAGIVGANPKKYMEDYVHPKTGVGTDLFADTIYRGIKGK